MNGTFYPFFGIDIKTTYYLYVILYVLCTLKINVENDKNVKGSCDSKNPIPYQQLNLTLQCMCAMRTNTRSPAF